MLLICEGTKTEPNFFVVFRDDKDKCKVEGEIVIQPKPSLAQEDDKLNEDFKTEIRRYSDLGECDEGWNKMESLKKMLPLWPWDDISDEIDDVEKRIKEEEEESETESKESYYDKWRAKEEKEDAQIEEMFNALRIYD